MGDVVQMAERTTAAPPLQPAMPCRTPELAFIMAIVAALPADVRNRVLFQVECIGQTPDCEASQEAAAIAAALSAKFRGRH